MNLLKNQPYFTISNKIESPLKKNFFLKLNMNNLLTFIGISLLKINTKNLIINLPFKKNYVSFKFFFC